MRENEGKLKALKTKILIPMVALIVGVAVVMGAASCLLSYQSAVTSLKTAMDSSASLAADAISNRLAVLTNVIGEVGSNSVLTDPDSTNSEKLGYLDGVVKKYNIVSAEILDNTGKAMKDAKNYSDEEFFKAAISGKPYTCSPVYDEAAGKLLISIAAPIASNAQTNKVLGVIVVTMDQAMINNTIEAIKMSENGFAYVIDKNGYTIADPDVNLVIERENIEELAKTNTTIVSLGELHARARSGESGQGTYTYKGDKKFLAFAPIPGTDGWAVCLNAPEKDFTTGVMTSVAVTLALVALSVVLGTVITNITSKRLSEPVGGFEKRLALLAQGDITSPVPDMKVTSSEMVNLKKSVSSTITNIGDIIKDIDYVLGEMADGNFTAKSQVPERYVGDYKTLLSAQNVIREKLNHTLNSIFQVSEQVSAGADQVSSGAQSLAQGATEQASSVEELSATINEISAQVRRSAEESEKANQLTVESGEIMKGSVEGMAHVSTAMNEISETSKNISKVIKVIDDIAFQTNILALNAAVEAARAGAAGKGFAVVADEVRNLSQKSSEAAKNTTVLIESSISAVEKGGKLVARASEDFTAVAEKSAQVVNIIGTIYEQAQQQAESVEHVSIGIEQVSSVVQMNSATSEESAAASEELSSQATVLKGLVEQFKLSE